MFNQKLRRAEVLRFFEKLPPCLVGLEACGGVVIGRAKLRRSVRMCA